MQLLDIQEIITKLRDNGFKVTPQRLAICKILFSRKDHPSAEDIHDEIKKEYPTISLATIYKTLHLLEKFRLVTELGFHEGSIRYDPDTRPHINLVCTKCGKITDYKSDSIDKFWSEIISEIRVKPDGQRLDLYYQCEECIKDKKR